ncbi:uncharacterized protein LOC132902963 [Amyelois transitella]|uniref:uncharacterized protein LOC132902963 n=1 Tax=Amyelois transitella TaxID=680683 RepID=UPI00298FFF4C|nr:uncharacterized protein LOC132902963 [Amyelois transitella]
MWRLCVVFVICIVAIENARAEVRPGDLKIIGRFKRSPHYCEPPPYWPPPPPPPPHWPPHRPHWPPPPPPPPYWEYQPSHDSYRQPEHQAKPCETCGSSSGSYASSNSESESGNAIAVAVARAKAQN